MNLKIIKINRVYKIILIKSGLIVSFEFINIMIQPDWLAQVEFITDRIQCVEYFMCSGVIRLVADNGITQHMIVFKFFSP